MKEELDNIKDRKKRLLIISDYEDIDIVDNENDNNENEYIDSLQTQLQDVLMKTTDYKNEISEKDEIISKLQQQVKENKENNEENNNSDDNISNNKIDYTTINEDMRKENEKLKYEINRRDEEINRLYQTINEKDNMLEIYQTLSNPIQINTNTNLNVFIIIIIILYEYITT